MAKYDLMRQKVNVTPGLIEHWEKTMKFELRNLIKKSLITFEDFGKEFQHQNRTFKIIGMTEIGHMILEEIVNQKSIYWECTRHFVQMKLDRFIESYAMMGGIMVKTKINYEESKLLLPPMRLIKKQEQIEDPEIEENSDEFFDQLESNFEYEEPLENYEL